MSIFPSPAAFAASLPGFRLSVLSLFLTVLPLPAVEPPAEEAPTVGTYFDGLGNPYGGCGIPQTLLETQDFVALNVYHTPGEYAAIPLRPLKGADTAVMGEFANGLNCGRWIEVTLGPYCKGTNDGAPSQPFCRGAGAAWVEDDFSGAVLNMIVADACADGNAWCRDSRRHLDLSKPSLARFTKDGKVLTQLLPDHWNNRGLEWKYIPAPDYSGDIRIHFLKGAQKYWVPIGITHLPNGIHAVEQKLGGVWKKAERYSDMGQGFILSPADTFRIRLLDADDKLVHGGREYVFAPPTTCGRECVEAATPAPYQAFSPDGAALRSHFPRTPRASRQSAQPRILAIPGGLQLDFQAPYAGVWKVELHDLAGRLALVSTACTAASGEGHVLLPLAPRGVYSVVLVSGRAVQPAGRIVLP